MTVSELMERLAKFPADADVVIADADTGWSLAVEGVEFENPSLDAPMGASPKSNTVFLWGNY